MDKVVIDREKPDKILEQERQRGMAHAFGLLQGGGYLKVVAKEKRLSEVINPVVRAAEVEAASRRPQLPAELRTVTVNGDRELPLWDDLPMPPTSGREGPMVQ